MTLEEAREEYLQDICELCHHPYAVESQAALEELCAACPVEMGLDKLLKLARSVGVMQAMQIVKEEMFRGGDPACM